MKTETYIANGKRFNSFEEVESYAKERGLRIANTEIIKGTHVITLNSVEQRASASATPQWWNDLYTDASGNCFSDADSGL